MDTFRKWLNKPKADDKSLLARFYHADRSLTAISSELDTFDGRAEPDRCSRLVSRLRQGQDKVLSITNQIMEELLGEDRAPRAFRAKFPEEVLQENLAGQLWFGAECLAAGSSIMNREQESKDMRPLAQAVTKSLGNVRNLLRDQCLRNNVPNSQTLHLDFNDSNTEQLYESLKIFDRLFAEFELRYVSAMVQVKTKHEYEMQEFICVLFSETLQRALTVGLLEQDKVDAFDPGLMFSIPRLAIVTGLVIYDRGPLNMDMPADQLSEMFRPYRSFLIKIRDLLRKLNKNELYQLEKLLCTNEDIHLKQLNVVNNNEGDNDSKNVTNNNNCDDAATTSSSSSSSAKNVNEESNTEVRAPELKEDAESEAVNKDNPKVFNVDRVFISNDVFTMSISSEPSSPSVSPSPSPLPSTSSTTSSPEWSDDENNGLPKEGDMASADCATGYLIPNTNLGNLLQSNEVPLTDNFIASEDDDFGSCNGGEDLPEADQELNGNFPSCSSRPIRTNVIDSSEESEQLTIKGTEGKSIDSRDSQYGKLEKSSNSSSAGGSSGKRSHRHHHHHLHSHRHHHHHHHHHHHNDNSRSSVATSSSSNSSASSSSTSSGSSSSTSDVNRHHSKKRSKNSTQKRDTSSGDTASSLSDGDPHEVTLALRAAGRMKFISTEYLLHRLFVSIASVADQLQTNFASDLRQILRSVFLMNVSPVEDEIEIPEKNNKDTTAELFEFRASENDVIQQQSAGSNQSIYSAEEVNPELDNVFNNSNGNINGTDRPPAIQRGHTVDLASMDNPTPVPVRNNIGRSRSLGEESHNDASPNTSERRNGTLSSYLRERRLSSGSRSPANSSSSTASNSPISERSAAHYTAVANNNLNNNTNHSNNSIINNNNNNNNGMDVPVAHERQATSPSHQIRLSPPVWVPDDKAPRCMSCTIPFTAFRRRHHCRNCGGVFCGGCSSTSTPLPKFGLTKAVRVCRECYIHQ